MKGCLFRLFRGLFRILVIGLAVLACVMLYRYLVSDSGAVLEKLQALWTEVVRPFLRKAGECLWTLAERAWRELRTAG